MCFKALQPCWDSAGEAAAEAIRNTVREELHVSCSCGIGPNRPLAKVASDMRKAAYLPYLVKKQQQYDSHDILSCTAFAGEAVAEAIRKRVRDEVRVTCSCGIGPNRLLAKVASDMRKPDGQYAISADNTAILRFVETLPIRKVQGIGKASASPPSLII